MSRLCGCDCAEGEDGDDRITVLSYLADLSVAFSTQSIHTIHPQEVHSMLSFFDFYAVSS